MVHEDCFGYIYGSCHVLKSLYCSTKKECPFFKTRMQFEEDKKKYAKPDKDIM